MLSHPASRFAFFSLPPALRLSASHTATSRRTFSLTPRRNVTLTELAVAGPTAILDVIHATGIPWYATIPVTAILVRGTIGYYVTVLPARRRQIVRQYLSPLSFARGKIRSNAVEWRTANAFARRRGNPLVPQQLFGATRAIWSTLGFISETHKVGKQFGAPMVSWRSFVNFGLLIAFVEAVRIKCGTREGLLSLLFGSFKETVSMGSAGVKKDTLNMSPEEALADRLQEARAANEGVGAAVDTTQEVLAQGQSTFFHDAPTDATTQLLQETTKDLHLMPANTPAYSEFLDPTLKIEGIAWLQDLTLPDPTFALPLSMSVIMAANALFRPKRPDNDEEKRSSDDQLTELKQPDETTSSAAPRTTMLPSGEIDMDAVLREADRVRQSSGRSARQLSKPKPSNSLNFSQRIGLSVSLLFFFVALKLPAAVLLYLIPAITTGFVQRRWLDLKYPIPVTIKPCTRPLRTKVRKEFE